MISCAAATFSRQLAVSGALVLVALKLAACGGEDSEASSVTPNGSPAEKNAEGGAAEQDGSPPVQTPPPALKLSPCEPSGKGKDYSVGPGSDQLASLDLVPWEELGPGDTVRIFPKPTPYSGKFLLSAKGTADAPVRICGVRGPGNERPVIDGNGATTRASLLGAYGNKDSDRDIHQARSIIVIKRHGTASEYESFPENIQIDGLDIRRAHPDYSFTDAAGVTKKYDPFGACIWLDRGHNITIADNDISDCSQGIFSRSTDEGPFAVTQNIRIVGNRLSNCGIVGDDHMHTSYVQSIGVVYELNTYGPLRAGANGSALKDRSVGAVIRYNRIEDGARALDLVESEDFPTTAMANPAYRSTFVYGNQIAKNASLGSFIHYGGDHMGSSPGQTWGEPIFRKGTLYFFHNTVYATGNEKAWIFQISTTEETAEIWNNVFVFEPSIKEKNLRMTQDVGTSWTAGGIVHLGKNWATTGVQDSDVGHDVTGKLEGLSNVLTGTSPPIDLKTFVPRAGSPILDVGAAGPKAAAGYSVDFQLDADRNPLPRQTKGAGIDLGAFEL